MFIYNLYIVNKDLKATALCQIVNNSTNINKMNNHL
jgi:hypothetical protein